ncbi:hypothetical protein ACB094_03G015600 [Castanea mollissima]
MKETHCLINFFTFAISIYQYVIAKLAGQTTPFNHHIKCINSITHFVLQTVTVDQRVISDRVKLNASWNHFSKNFFCLCQHPFLAMCVHQNVKGVRIWYDLPLRHLIQESSSLPPPAKIAVLELSNCK